jgi:integrase
MPAHIRQRSAGSWELRYSLGVDPATGKRRTATVTVSGDRKTAESELRRLLRTRDTGEHVDPTRMAVRDWLQQWLDTIRQEVAPLNAEEAHRLLAAIRHTRVYWPVLLALATGMRRGEILALRWQNVDLERGALRVVESLEQLALGVRQTGETLVCGRADGELKSPLALTQEFSRLVRRMRASPRVRFHDLRHSHATQLLRAGVHPKVMSERGGTAAEGSQQDGGSGNPTARVLTRFVGSTVLPILIRLREGSSRK